MKNRMFVVPGTFVPNNDVVALLTYKRLRNLDLDMDVFAFKGKDDKGLLKELTNDDNFKKFNITYTSNLETAIPRNHPLRLPIGLILMNKYVGDSLKQFEKNNYKYLFTSIVPGICHICGKKIKKKHPEVIWYASFSDPFKNSPYKDADLENRSFIYRIMYKVGAWALYNKKYEEAAIYNADKFIFICEEQRDFTISQYPDLDRDELLKKSIIMPLTYIPTWDMYKNLIDVNSETHKPINAVHLGRLYGLRRIDSFLEALKQLKQEDKDIENKIVFHQYSEIQTPDIKKIKEYGLEKLFVLHDTVSYDESTRIMKEADALVLFDTLMPNSPNQPYLPSKIVEYLLLKKPILGICDNNSPSYRTLKQYGFNTVGSEVDIIKDNIKALINSIITINYSLDELNSDNYNMLKL